MTTAEDTTLPFPCPSDWRTSYVADEFFLILGKMLDAEKNVGAPRPYLGNKSVQWGRIDTEDLSLIKLTPGDLRRYRLMDGDLLVCEGGDIGRSAIWRGQLDECYFQKALHRVRPRGGFSPVLLRYLLEYYSKTGFLLNFATQTSIAHLPKDKFEVLPLPKPPLKEQEAIAEALSDVDALIEGLERLIAKKRLIKQGAMQDLLTAKRRLPGFTGEWVERKLGSLGKCLRGVSYDGQADLSETDNAFTVRLLRANNVKEGRIVFSDMQFVKADRVGNHQLLRNSDVLICMANGSRALVGKAASFETPDEMAYTFGAFMGAFRPTFENCDPRYIAHLLQSDRYRRLLNVILSGSAINNLAPSQIEGFEFPIPEDSLEQEAIAVVLNDMDAEIQALETRLEKARQVKEGMMQNLLTGRIRLV